MNLLGIKIKKYDSDANPIINILTKSDKVINSFWRITEKIMKYPQVSVEGKGEKS